MKGKVTFLGKLGILIGVILSLIGIYEAFSTSDWGELGYTAVGFLLILVLYLFFREDKKASNERDKIAPKQWIFIALIPFAIFLFFYIIAVLIPLVLSK